MPEASLTGSPELNRLMGFPEDEPLDPEAVRARYAPGEPERLAAIVQAALARGESSFEAEFRYLRAPDDCRWLRLRCDLVLDAQRQPVKAIGVVFDETDRRRAEEDLRVSEARLRLAADAAGAGIWEWDLGTGLSVWSPQEYALFGVDPDTPPEELQAAWRRLVHPEDLPRQMAVAQEALRDGTGYVADYRIIRDDGRTRWMRSHAVAVPGPDGRPRRLVGIELDATPEHHEAEALRARAARLADEVLEQRRELERLHDLSQDLLVVSGFDGYLKSVNPAWTQLLGYSEEELKSRPLMDFIHPDDHERVLETVSRVLGGSGVYNFQDRLVAKDGRVLWINWTGVPEGELFYAVGRDITREREQEEILRQSQKMDALGQLTGGIAHDFNNLLQAVQGSLALIARRPDDAERVATLAAHGLEAARRGANLTAQLLAFSRSQRLDQRPVGVGALLRGLQDLLQRSLGPLAEVALDLPEEEITACADPTQLEMTVLNLAINARDAMPGGGRIALRAAPVRVEADPELPRGDYVLLEVTDAGTGMAPDVARRAFEPFFTTKGLGKGTGLGLSQVYGMARQAGGTARIESRLGQGTTVRLWLPVAVGEASPERPAPSAAPVRGRAARVLVVDDDEDVRRWLTAALHPLGHEVLEAADGAAALCALDGDPEVAVVDFAMPGMSGAEVAVALRQRRPGLPVILATGYADSGAIPPGLRVLRKPFGLDELEAALAEALGPAAP